MPDEVLILRKWTGVIRSDDEDAYVDYIASTGLTDYGALFAMSVLSLFPVFVVFLIAQKALIEGIATTGLK